MNIPAILISSNLLYIPISSALTLISSLTGVAVAISVPLIKGWNKFKKSKILDAFGDEDLSKIITEEELVITDKKLKVKIDSELAIKTKQKK